MHPFDIAETIKQQIRLCDPYAMWAYGVSRTEVLTPHDTEHRGGIRLYVSPRRPVVSADIVLQWNDTYKISFNVMTADHTHQPCRFVHEVYCDQLVNVLDWMEETEE